MTKTTRGKNKISLKVFTHAVILMSVIISCVSAAPAGWEKTHRAPSSLRLKITFAVKQNNQQIENLFNDIALPSGSHFRKFISMEELAVQVGPSEKVVKTIDEYIRSIGGEEIDWTYGKEYVQFFLSVSQAESAFQTTISLYSHKVSQRVVLRADTQYLHIPPHIDQHLDLTLGLLDFFDTKDERRGIKREGRGRKENEIMTALSKINKRESRSTNTSPYILMVMGSESDTYVYFYAICSNGMYSSNPSSPCSEYSNQIQSFNITTQQSGYGAVSEIITPYSPSSSSSSHPPPSSVPCYLVANQTVCIYHFRVQAYNRVEISIYSNYASGSSSDTYLYPTLYSPTPYVTPQLVYSMYNIPIGTRSVHPSNSQAIVSFEEQYYSHSDLNAFFDATGLKREEPVLIGYNNDTMPGGEATLDVQWVMGIGQGVPTTTWSFPTGDYILNWAIAVSNTSSPPLVTSISYGDTEVGYEQKSGYGLQYIYRMNYELMKMAERGLTVIAGSGDAGWSNVGEMGNDLSAPDPTCTPGRAFYPSVSPYVISLSASFITTNNLPLCGQGISPVPGDKQLAVPIECTSVRGETAVSVSGGISWTTGGGFSNVTARHEYQNYLVTSFLNTSSSLPPSEYFNASGQGYADIATIGWNQLVVWGGVFFPIGGTSASGPVAAGLFALINDALLSAGKQPLGFINPLLYQWAVDYPDAFNDITLGSNNDGDIQPPGSPYPIFCPYGFTAQAGWDPVTGLGSPNFSRLKQLALSKL